MVLLRHGYAGERVDWTGPDAARPLDGFGRRQAEALADLLPMFAPDRLVSATPQRCRQTLEPVAEGLDLPVEIDGSFDETAEPAATVAALRGLAGTAEASVVSSQGKIVRAALSLLLDEPAQRYATAKGDGWLLAFSGDRCVAADAVPASASGGARVDHDA